MVHSGVYWVVSIILECLYINDIVLPMLKCTRKNRDNIIDLVFCVRWFENKMKEKKSNGDMPLLLVQQ